MTGEQFLFLMAIDAFKQVNGKWVQGEDVKGQNANIHHLRSTDVSSANASEGLRDGDYKQAEAMESKAQDELGR